MSINKKLAEIKGLDEDTITAIECVHKRLVQVLNRPNNFGEPEKVNKIVEGMEYTLQFLWGFEINSDYHRYWNRISGCTCPVLDNDERIGTKYRIYNNDCPFHGAKS